MLHKTSGNLIVNGFGEGKPTSFTVDTDATVSVVHPELISNSHPEISFGTIPSMWLTNVAYRNRQ